MKTTLQEFILEKAAAKHGKEIGRGGDSVIYAAGVGRVMLQTKSQVKIGAIDQLFRQRPDLFPQVYEVDLREKTAVMERLNTKKVLDLHAACMEHLEANAPEFAIPGNLDGVLNVLYVQGLGRHRVFVPQYLQTLTALTNLEGFVPFAEAYKILTYKVAEAMVGVELADSILEARVDATWDNLGYGKDGNLRLLDI